MSCFKFHQSVIKMRTKSTLQNLSTDIIHMQQNVRFTFSLSIDTLIIINNNYCHAVRNTSHFYYFYYIIKQP